MAIGFSHSYPSPSAGKNGEDELMKKVNFSPLGKGNEVVNGDEIGFDPSEPPPFKIGDIRAAIPEHCWVKDPWKSYSYVVRDISVAFGLVAIALHFNSWIFWPVYWFAQGTIFWAIFVLGHDCGHGSFSDNPDLNNIVGHILHSFILVPYHGWRISHRTHHQNHGHVENDESWVPLPEKIYKKLDLSTKFLRYKVPFPLFAYPLYLWSRSPGKKGSHFNPYSDLFKSSERKLALTSTICWAAMVAFLFCLTIRFGPLLLLKLYGVPYVEWSYLRGGLTTVDRDYGWFNKIHHDIGTHVIHHLFPQIPHYHLEEATRAAKPVMGMYYREPTKSGPFPYHLLQNLVRSINEDHFVSDSGEIVYYQKDSQLS